MNLELYTIILESSIDHLRKLQTLLPAKVNESRYTVSTCETQCVDWNLYEIVTEIKEVTDKISSKSEEIINSEINES